MGKICIECNQEFDALSSRAKKCVKCRYKRNQTKICVECHHAFSDPRTYIKRCQECRDTGAAWCPDAKRIAAEKRAQVQEENYIKAVNANLMSSYGITYEQREEMLRSQNYECAICKQVLDSNTDGPAHSSVYGIYGKRRQQCHVDHCHKTGKVRDILCRRCNQLLGQARDSVSLLQGAIAYLEKHQTPDAHTAVISERCGLSLSAPNGRNSVEA